MIDRYKKRIEIGSVFGNVYMYIMYKPKEIKKKGKFINDHQPSQ